MVLSRDKKKLVQKVVAVVVIAAMLSFVGVSPIVVVCVVGVGFLVWRFAQRSESRDTERIFDFYVSADEILRDDNDRWYAFEVTEVIDAGEQVIGSMPDAPRLAYFALGALYYSVGDHAGAVEHLVHLDGNQVSGKRCVAAPTPQLRRYVERLREMERHPDTEPQTIAAIRNLERACGEQSAQILVESQKQLDKIIKASGRAGGDSSIRQHIYAGIAHSRPLSSIEAPPPISEVLNDVYQEDSSPN